VVVGCKGLVFIGSTVEESDAMVDDEYAENAEDAEDAEDVEE
jgi:hypothetical protein